MPSFDEAWFIRGWIQMLRGEADEAVRSLEQAIRLCPIPNSVKFGVLGTAYRNVGKYEKAIQTFKRCLELYPDFVYAHTSMAVVYSMQDDLAAARREVEETLKVDPTYSVQRFISPNLYRDSAVMERSADALRRAGMPEGR
jgi:adenylate cyclase